MARSRNPASKGRDRTQELGVGRSDMGAIHASEVSLDDCHIMEMTHHPPLTFSLSQLLTPTPETPKAGVYTLVPNVQRKKLKAREKVVTL